MAEFQQICQFQQVRLQTVYGLRPWVPGPEYGSKVNGGSIWSEILLYRVANCIQLATPHNPIS